MLYPLSYGGDPRIVRPPGMFRERPYYLWVMELTAEEIRVLGCLIEKQRTTPDQYPLTLNSLRLACNQTTSRDSVVDYSDHDVQDALDALRSKGFIRAISGAGMRTVKFRHVAGEVLGLSDDATGVLAVLALRGPQTAGEVRQRSERMGVSDVESALHELVANELAAELGREPGQSAIRWSHLLSGAPLPTPSVAPSTSSPSNLQGQIDELRTQVEELQARLDRLEQTT